MRWQIVPAILETMIRNSAPERSKAVTDAIMNMVELDVATLEAAYQ